MEPETEDCGESLADNQLTEGDGCGLSAIFKRKRGKNSENDSKCEPVVQKDGTAAGLTTSACSTAINDDKQQSDDSMEIPPTLPEYVCYSLLI